MRTRSLFLSLSRIVCKRTCETLRKAKYFRNAAHIDRRFSLDPWKVRHYASCTPCSMNYSFSTVCNTRSVQRTMLSRVCNWINSVSIVSVVTETRQRFRTDQNTRVHVSFINSRHVTKRQAWQWLLYEWRKADGRHLFRKSRRRSVNLLPSFVISKARDSFHDTHGITTRV